MTVRARSEAQLAARWKAGEFDWHWLRTPEGDRVRVVFGGRPGGPAGPDFRDAVVEWHDGSRVCGDIELHVRAQGWEQHGHHHDARYDQVVLHVVERADGARATRLRSGASAALVEVGEAFFTSPVRSEPRAVQSWPCLEVACRAGPSHVRKLLERAGDARFEQHALDFVRRLAATSQPVTESPACLWSVGDRIVFSALAEGLAYGRDRQALRTAGEWLAQHGVPDRLTSELARLPALDAKRLHGLMTWFERWEHTGPWVPLQAALAALPAASARRVLDELRVVGGFISPSRAAILAVNVVLPFAAAWAGIHGAAELAARARTLYAAFKGLPSNQITREMCRQLGLPRQPAGARAQQGLQHLWAMHCREKQCHRCPCSRAG